MATTTPNLGLTLPTGAEKVSRQIINDNMKKIDNSFGALSLSGDWTPNFGRDTATNVTAKWYLFGSVLVVTAHWTNSHVSGQGNSYITVGTAVFGSQRAVRISNWQARTMT